MLARSAVAQAILFAGTCAYATIPPEAVTTAPPPSADVPRLFVMTFDFARGFLSEVVVVYTGTEMKLTTQFAVGHAPQANLSPDHQKLYIASTYFSRGVRGGRSDVVEIYDVKSLAYEREIIVPAKRAQSFPVTGLQAISSDGRYVFVQNATPASSVTVVDVVVGKVINEIQTAGCWSIHPSSVDPRAFSTLCGDGVVANIRFAANGKVVSATRSAKLFDPEDDPLVPVGAKWGDEEVFITYKGLVHSINVSTDVATQRPPWALPSGGEATEGWRPGGMNVVAVDEKSGRLFLPMHRNGADGTHHHPADEIWIVDLHTHALIERIDGERSISLTVGGGAQPSLYAITANRSVIQYSASTGVKHGTVTPVSDPFLALVP